MSAKIRTYSPEERLIEKNKEVISMTKEAIESLEVAKDVEAN